LGGDVKAVQDREEGFSFVPAGQEQFAHPTRNVFSTRTKWREKTNQLHFGGRCGGSACERKRFLLRSCGAGTICGGSACKRKRFLLRSCWRRNDSRNDYYKKNIIYKPDVLLCRRSILGPHRVSQSLYPQYRNFDWAGKPVRLRRSLPAPPSPTSRPDKIERSPTPTHQSPAP